jgi:CO/xanthine dehydrogenase Mo-binding subunit
VIVCRDDRTCRGIGFAAGFKNVGYSFGYQDNICAGIELRGRSEIVEAIVSVGSAEVGQGTHTAILQMAAEALGISPSCVRLVVSDTATSPGSSGSCSASRMTLMAGNALRGAAEKALVHWRDGERPAVGVCTYLAPRTTTIDPVTGYGSPNFAYGYVAVAAEVEVDRESGGLRVLRVVCANDVGKAINPQQAAGQIEGGVVQALGWLTCENFQTAGGSVLTPNFSTYLIPSSSDVPETVKAVLVEKPDPVGPWGARGMGEMPFIVVAPAVMAAVHDATGIWFDEFPLTQELLLPKLTRSNGGSPQGTAPGGRSPF